jgi:hypothetical protein
MISIFNVRSNGEMASSPPLGGSVVGAVDDSGQNLSGRSFQSQDLAGCIFNHRRDAKCCQGSRAKEGGMAVSAVRRLAFFFMTNTLEPRSYVPHTGLRLVEAYGSESGTPVPLSFSSTDPSGACRNAGATQLECSAGVPPAIGILSPAGETPNTVALSRKPRRGLLVRTRATLANTMVPALTSRALLAKRQINATGLGGTPALRAVLKSRTPVSKNGTVVPKIGTRVPKLGTSVMKSGTAARNFNWAAIIFRTDAANFGTAPMKFGTREMDFRTPPMNSGTAVMKFGTLVMKTRTLVKEFITTRPLEN